MRKNILFLLLFPLIILSQSENSIKSTYLWYDQLVGVENTPLFNGVEYIFDYSSSRDKTPFFNSPEFKFGNVVYNNQKYFDIPLIYDVYNDEVIIKITNTKQETLLKLISNKVNGFNIGDASFIGIMQEDIFSFYKIVGTEKNLLLLKKLKKSKLKKINNGRVFFEYLDKEPEYYLFQNSILTPINSNNALISIYPEFKKELKQALKNLDFSKNVSQEEQFKLLLKEISKLN